MGLFRRKNTDFIDLGERHKKQQARADEMRQDAQESQSSSGNDSGGFGFFGAIANTARSNSSEDLEYMNVSSGAEEKKRKLAK
ncbi:MAG: hypothetical protein ABII03_04255, partial [Nanoarchaeota archaeon]